MNLYCTGFECRPRSRLFPRRNSFYPENSDRSGCKRPPAQYVNARQLISNSRPNGLRVYRRSDSLAPPALRFYDKTVSEVSVCYDFPRFLTLLRLFTITIVFHVLRCSYYQYYQGLTLRILNRNPSRIKSR